MDHRLIASKLDLLRRRVARIESKRPIGLRRLRSDEDLQDIIAQNLTQAVQLCVDIGAHVVTDLDVAAPETMGEVFLRLRDAKVLSPTLANRLVRAVGFRNVAVHDYAAIDWNIVCAICQRRLADFRLFARAIDHRVLQPRAAASMRRRRK
jgi:uncharacterized protein YutE (UPF0331/DUF86 family)